MTTATKSTNGIASTDVAEPLLLVRDLQTHFWVEGGIARAVDGVSFAVHSDEVLGIVGESGSGKSVTALSIIRLIPDPPGRIVGGQILLSGQDLLRFEYRKLRQVRGREIGMVFQEPMSALNPVMRIGTQVMEPIFCHERTSRRDAFERAVDMLKRVGIPDAARRMRDYPHQFSGGMRQRVMIAMALVCNPRLLIADEPTTALDVTTQAQILELMLELKDTRPGSSLVLITHDLGVVAETCDRVVVMYGGRIQEVGNVEQIFHDPQHPYTRGLLDSLPSRDGPGHRRLRAIPGNVPAILDLPTGCKFCTRCELAFARCKEEEPVLHDLGGGHIARCHLLEDGPR